MWAEITLREFAISFVLVIFCEPVNEETESRNFSALEAPPVYRLFCFCLNANSPTVASPYHVFLEETHVFRIICGQRSLSGSLLSVLSL